MSVSCSFFSSAPRFTPTADPALPRRPSALAPPHRPPRTLDIAAIRSAPREIPTGRCAAVDKLLQDGLGIQQLVHSQAPWISRYALYCVGNAIGKHNRRPRRLVPESKPIRPRAFALEPCARRYVLCWNRVKSSRFARFLTAVHNTIYFYSLYLYSGSILVRF